MKSLVISD